MTVIKPDKPFLSGVSGKYKLLIRKVAPKYNRFEYELVDAEYREYSAVSTLRYSEGQILRCMVTFSVVKARFVVIDTAICSKQDLTTPLPSPKSTKTKTGVAKEKPEAVAIKAGKKPMSDLLQLGRPRKKKSSGVYNLRVIERNRVESKYLYDLEDADGNKYTIETDKYLIVGSIVPFNVRVKTTEGGILKAYVTSVFKPRDTRHINKEVWHSGSRHDTRHPIPCEGDHFHIIYTPMGNKR